MIPIMCSPQAVWGSVWPRWEWRTLRRTADSSGRSSSAQTIGSTAALEELSSSMRRCTSTPTTAYPLSKWSETVTSWWESRSDELVSFILRSNTSQCVHHSDSAMLIIMPTHLSPPPQVDKGVVPLAGTAGETTTQGQGHQLCCSLTTDALYLQTCGHFSNVFHRAGWIIRALCAV